MVSAQQQINVRLFLEYSELDRAESAPKTVWAQNVPKNSVAYFSRHTGRMETGRV